MNKIIRLTLVEKGTSKDIDINIQNLFCGGFTGRNKNTVNKHIKEINSLGIHPPIKTPALYHISPYLLTSDEEIEVVGDKTSGEVEPVILLSSGEKYLTVGSDQTDRELERLSYPKSKQICPKVIAKQIWRYKEVNDHYDKLILRSEVEKNEQKYLYQEGPVSLIMNPFDIIQFYSISKKRTALFSGTIPTKNSKLIHADRYRIELIDPILGRKLVHTYSVKVI